jgi:hydrophobe/amphiphile efflux-1 (HAE1) family protein
MNFSYPFIRRPVGTTLLAIGLFLVGAVAYLFLPVSSLPTVDLPTIRVSASQPGASPETIAATVAAPLERRLGEIPGVTEITSQNTLGTSGITVQFDLDRNIDGAARDVQAAINAATTDLPSDLPSQPTFRKMNPAAFPVLIIALTSKTIPASAMYDAADSIVAQRMMQVDGVANVQVAGAEQPAIRIRINPILTAAAGIALDDVRLAIVNTNAQGPLGEFNGTRAETIATNDQLRTVADYKNLVIKAKNGNVVKLPDIADIIEGTRNTQSAAWFNLQPAILLFVTKQANANVIDTVDQVRALLPEIKRLIPAGIEMRILTDRTETIRASIHDMQATLAGSICMVMLVVFLFLRRTAPTLAAGVTVPLSLAGTCAAMWVAGFSIDNLSLMALAVSVGFVVDDAIVMIENVFRNLEKGHSPLRATIEGAQQIGFTVISISVSLTAAFIPLLFMGGIIGRFFREFGATLAFAIAISTVVSLTVTPMICAHFIREIPSRNGSRFDRLVESVLDPLVRAYAATLSIALRHRAVMLMVMLATVVLTADLYYKIPKGQIPQDDTGLVFGGTRASPDVSFKTMVDLQRQVATIIGNDPAVVDVGTGVGGASFFGANNRGTLFFSLKPLAERDGLSTQRVIDRLRGKLSNVPGIVSFMQPVQDLRTGGRQTDSQYQFTLWGADLNELSTWVPKAVDVIKQVPGVTDVTTDRDASGLQLGVTIDRTRASAYGVKMQAVDASLNDAFAQRQISTIYSPRNQYRVIVEIDPQFQHDPTDLTQIYTPGFGGTAVPLSVVAKLDRGLAPLVVNHQGQFPSVTISFGLRPGINLDAVAGQIQDAVAALHLPDAVHAEFAGDARAFTGSAGSQIVLIVAALFAVYIVLGVLYESLAHPLTIISTLPSAGLGALLALMMFNTELTIIAFVGIILLIGIVKKNGIMLVDFALEGERQRGLTPEQAIYEACLTRFRPILMTTLASLLGAIPLVIATGPGSELRRPLGITIIGGLVVSQVLTLYTTPIIYLLLDRLHRRLGGAARGRVLPNFGHPRLGPAE